MPISRGLVGKRSGSISLQTIRPGSRFLTWLARKPSAVGVTIHSIVGDLGKGDDGLVSSKSSYLADATSELVMRVDHGQTYKNSEAARELRRMLEGHLTVK